MKFSRARSSRFAKRRLRRRTSSLTRPLSPWIIPSKSQFLRGPAPASPMSTETNTAPVIQLYQLAKTYKTGEVEVKAVRGVNLDIQRGDFVAVIGASGSGKSTLMNMLGCLDQPTRR